MDDQKFGEEIITACNFEMYLQELAEPETVTSDKQVVVFLRKFSPSELTLGPFQGKKFLDVIKKIGEMFTIFLNPLFFLPNLTQPYLSFVNLRPLTDQTTKKSLFYWLLHHISHIRVVII